jgi:hypothetical protein
MSLILKHKQLVCILLPPTAFILDKETANMTKFLGFCTGALALVLAAQASAQVVTLSTTMSGGEEVPVLNTGMVGSAEVSVDVANREVVVNLRVFNAPTATTAGHIHVGAAGISGPVVINFPSGVVGRTGDFVMSFRLSERDFVARPAQGISTFDDALQAIVLGNAYVNIHTTQNPGGEIRGQLKR